MSVNQIHAKQEKWKYNEFEDQNLALHELGHLKKC